MAHVLLTWELGTGLAHVVPMRLLSECLLERGHRVTLLLRDLAQATWALEGLNVTILQAPFKQQFSAAELREAVSFAQILHNIGFGEPKELAALANAWDQIIDLLSPDAILFDHSPTALLAARGRNCLCIVHGNGFLCPPPVTPLPAFHFGGRSRPLDAKRVEDQVLDNANAWLRANRRPCLPFLGELYAHVDDTWLMTLEEFDLYAPRTGAQYLGPWPPLQGSPPAWPKTTGKRVFAYLKPFAAIDTLFQCIQKLELGTVLWAPGLDADRRRQLAGSSIQLVDRPVDLLTALDECDVCVSNGTHGTGILALLAGKPALHVPLVLEQIANALSVQKIGAGLIARPNNPDEVGRHMQALVHNIDFSRRAQEYAASHRGCLSGVGEVMHRLTALLDR